MRIRIHLRLHLWTLSGIFLSISFLQAQVRLLNRDELPKSTIYTSLQDALNAGDKVYRLDLSNQELSDLSADITLLTDIQELNISGNHFQEIPESIYRLPRLQILKADHNQIFKISESIVFLQNLEELYLIGNPILEVSYQIQNLPRLRKLELSQNLTFELYQNDNNFQNLTLLSALNSSILKITEANNLPAKSRKATLSEADRRYASPLKTPESSASNSPSHNNSNDPQLVHTISGLQKDKDQLEEKVNYLTKDLDQSQSLHQKLQKEKDSVLHAKKAVLEEKQLLEAQIQSKKLTSRLLLWGSILLILGLLGGFGIYIYRIRHDYSSLKAKLDEQEEEIEDNEDIIRQQAHIISEQNQILKNLKDENKTQNLSY